jgi:capsular exopolysaccharide synthesis family protein
LAQAGKSTLLLDCDLRSPALHKIFALRNQHGITDVMLGTAHLQEVWQEPLPGLQELKLITVGPVPPNPAELASSARLGELFDRARRDFDYVLVDTPPVGLVSDPLALAARTDGVLLVFDGRSTRKAAVQKSVQSLASVGANVLGTAMNNVRGAKGKERYHYPYP